MAAGLGTRLRPFTLDLPKPLLPLCGVPMVQFALDSLLTSGLALERVAYNFHHLPDAWSRVALDFGGLERLPSDESGLLLGSAGGLARALPMLQNEPFLLLNADVVGEADLAALVRHHERLRQRHGVVLTLAIHQGLDGSDGLYREIHVDRHGERIQALGQPAAGRPFYCGFAVIEPEALAGISADEPSEFVPRILEPAIRSGRAGAFPMRGMWKDIGSPQLWLSAHREVIDGLETGMLPKSWRSRIESGSRRLASRIWISRQADERSWFRRPSLELGGPCWLGCDAPSALSDEPNLRVGPSAVIYDSRGLADVTDFSNAISWGGHRVSFSNP